MTALRDHVAEQSSSNPTDRPKKIEHHFLINAYASDSECRKLVLRDLDDQTLKCLVRKVEGPVISENPARSVSQNYQFFREKLRENSNLDFVETGVGRLAVIDVRLDAGKDDPQQIFESLNSTGLDLTQADLVRNYILMRLEKDDQTRLYQQFWQKIESLFAKSTKQFDNFLRDFIALDRHAQKQGRIDQVYATFRRDFEECKADLEKLEILLEKMVSYAHYYAAFVMGTGEFPKVADQLERVRSLATTPAILVMCLLQAHKQESMSIADLEAALDLIESYLVRRDVCGKQTRSYWQQFSKLAFGLDMNNVLDSLTVNIYWLRNTNYAFPMDREFRHALEEEQLYGRQICRTLLEGLENRKSKEKTNTTSYTIEHIMPQNENLHVKWEKMLSEDWKEIQKKWIHRLGNLTLTAYNRIYSDKPFEEKKSIQNGFDDSPLRLNQYVKTCNKWTAYEMKSRGVKLADSALDIWRQLKVSESSLRRFRVRFLRNSTGNIEVTKLGMDEVALEIFNAFQRGMQMLEESVIEVATPKSVSYHSCSGNFVCEILPRTKRIQVHFNMEISECVPCNLNVYDTSDYKFITYARYATSCFVDVSSVEEVGTCQPLLRQALVISTD